MKMIAFYCLFCFLVLQSESSKVSPKLDFESTDKMTSNDEMSPKIQESRSSEESPFTLLNKNDKNIVGIRTDITFEITDDNKNTTKKHKDVEGTDDDDIIPVFKGYGNAHHEPKSYGNNHRWDTINIPVFHGTDDESSGGRHNGGDWVQFVPLTSVWTTERNNYLTNIDSQRRYKTDINLQKPWKPCHCNNDQVGFKSIPNYGRRSFVPTTMKVVKIDDKLDRTFRDEDKSKK